MRRRWLLFLLSIAVPLLVLAGCGDNAYKSVSDEDSEEACLYEVSQDLDDGDWNGVLSSSCADRMDRAAAYVGLAGYDINEVITSLVEANDEQTGDTIDLYMNNLIGIVTGSSLGSLSSAKTEYSAVPEYDDDYLDARFNNVVIVNSLIALSNLKGVLDPEGDGISDCDINGNGTSDEADAFACALYVVAGLSCSSVGASEGSPSSGLSFSGYLSTYTGYQISIDNTLPASGCSTTYQKLLNSTSTLVVTTTADVCTDLGGSGTWPCPYEGADGQPVDVVTTFQDAISSSSSYLDSLLDAGQDEGDVNEAMGDLLNEACGADGVCTSAEFANYVSGLN